LWFDTRELILMAILDAAIRKADAEAYVMYASSADANMRYLTGFQIGDPVVYLRRPGERGTLIVPQMEYDRAVTESSCAVMTRADAGFFEILEKEKDTWRIIALMIAGQVKGKVLVPPAIPYALAHELERYCGVAIEREALGAMRFVKSEDEIGRIRGVQRATEAAMDLALSLIRDATVRDGLLYSDGEALTSERVRRAMHVLLMERGCRATDTIVACGAETAQPHNKGAGTLRENEPIVIDVFPQDEATGYYADMTRTVVRGEPDPAIEEMYDAVREAQHRAKAMIRPGITGKDVHCAVVEYFKELGYESRAEGFVHSLGHGVGLEVHERPSLSPSGGVLAAGHVVTVEPGLYFRGIGGVRLEDLGVVTKEGFDCFTKYKEVIRI
jgi:Xaa-Pro aminopeptidase